MFRFTSRVDSTQIEEFTYEEMEAKSNSLLATVATSSEYGRWLLYKVNPGVVTETITNLRFQEDYVAHLLTTCCSTETLPVSYYYESEPQRVIEWYVRPAHYVDWLLDKETTLVQWNNGDRVTHKRGEFPVFIPSERPVDESVSTLSDELAISIALHELAATPAQPTEEWEQQLMEPIVEEPTDDVVLERAYGERVVQLDETAKNRLLRILRDNKEVSRLNEDLMSQLRDKETEICRLQERDGTFNITGELLTTLYELKRTFLLTVERSNESYFFRGVQDSTFVEHMKDEYGVYVDTTALRESNEEDDETRVKLATVIANVAEELDWCHEYDEMAERFGWPTREELGIEHKRNWSIRGNVTITLPVFTSVTARDEDGAFSMAEDSEDSDSVAYSVMDSLGIAYSTGTHHAIRDALDEGNIKWEEAEQLD